MNVLELVEVAQRATGVRRVFGEPVERDGLTVIPAATVTGGAGGGGGRDPAGQSGEGGGIGLRARPAGAYVIHGDRVNWRPALDVNRLVTAAAVVAAVHLLTRARR